MTKKMISMNKKMISMIRDIGLESYIEDVFIKKARRTNLIWSWSFFVLGILLLLGGFYGGFVDPVEDFGTTGGVILIGIGAGGLVIGWLLHPSVGKRSPDDYKQELTKRYGDYRAALKEIGDKIIADDAEIHVLDRSGIYAVADWMVVLCKSQGVHFIRKSEIAAIIGGSGTDIIWDDGTMTGATFSEGDYSWEQAFLILAVDNPYLLSNDDLFTLDDGSSALVDKGPPLRMKDSEWRKLIADQYVKNKSAGIVANWAKEFEEE